MSDREPNDPLNNSLETRVYGREGDCGRVIYWRSLKKLEKMHVPTE
jgi:hypothetical protein